MDSSSLLDYALFQLTPTRTRCDLVLFSGGKSEKLASGLLEPFITHLRSAKDQIAKGGYSITLRAPTKSASWFTKGTLERFVRFVSTPEVLERFVTIEKEILQIENSVQANELARIAEEDADSTSKKSIAPFKKGESDGAIEDVQQEKSKHRLQRVLETRKAVLRREQAMAYARAFVAGYEMDCIHDLIAFADAFGASRLREACIDFKELCNRKRGDGLWMDALAAVEVCTQPELPYLGTNGIILTTENNTPSHTIMHNFQNGGHSNGQLERGGSLDASVSESTPSPASSDLNQGQVLPTTATTQFPMAWQNQFPPFMYNYQNPVMHQMPPYQGYPFPAMQVPPHYQGPMQWPSNTDEYKDGSMEPDHRRNRKSSSRKKDKSSDAKGFHNSEQDAHTEPTDSTSESDLDAYLEQDREDSSAEKVHKRRNKKKSSRMVVIRNINYITSKKKDGETDEESDESSLDEDDIIDGDSLKQRLEDAVGSMEKYQKSSSRHPKKIGGKKSRNTANNSNGDVNQYLEDDSVDDVSEGVQTNQNWAAFQNLLLKDDDSSPKDIGKQQNLDVQDEYFTIQSSASGHFPSSEAVDLETEKGTKQRMVATDAFVITERDQGHEGNTRLEIFENGEHFRPSMRKGDYVDEELLFSQRAEESGRDGRDTLPDADGGSSVIKSQKGEDWFIIDQPSMGISDAANDSSIFNESHDLAFGVDYIQTEKNRKDVFEDDSFMVQSRSLADDQRDSQWKTDISMMSDFTIASHHESGTPELSGNKSKPLDSYEPDDLCMVLVRDSGPEPATALWAADVDYEMDMSFKEAVNRHSDVRADECVDDKPTIGIISNGDPEKKLSGKEVRSKPLRGSLTKSKTEIMSRNRKPSAVSKAAPRSKAERDEENRKKMEELAIQRQKRIAERSSASGFSPASSKRLSAESTKLQTPLKNDKQTARSATLDTKRLSLPKAGITSSTIDRLASVKKKEPSAPSKSIQPKKTSTKVNGAMAATSSPRTSRDENKNSASGEPKSSNRLNRTISTSSGVMKDQPDVAKTILQTGLYAPREAQHMDVLDGKTDILEPASTIPNIEEKTISDVGLVEKSYSEAPIGSNESYLIVNEYSTALDTLKSEDSNREVSVTTPVINGFTTETKVDSLPEKPKHNLTSTTTEEKKHTTNGRLSVSSEISEEEIIPYPTVKSTPPSTIEVSLESTPSRKKWTSNESSPSAAKGLKKLLMFGRKKPALCLAD